MNPQPLHTPTEVSAFNPALFAQQPRSFEGVNSQAMHVDAPRFDPASHDLANNFRVDTSTIGQPNLAWQYKDAKAAEDAREVFAKAAEAIYIGAFMLKLDQDIAAMARQDKEEKELVNA